MRKRKGFALLYAVFLMIIVATIGMHTLFLINSTTVNTVNEHIKTQMNLYTSSSIEYTLLWMSENKTNSTTTQDLNISYPGGYNFTIHIKPIAVPVNIPESQGIVLIDVKGEYSDKINHIITTKRTMQKP